MIITVFQVTWWSLTLTFVSDSYTANQRLHVLVSVHEFSRNMLCSRRSLRNDFWFCWGKILYESARSRNKCKTCRESFFPIENQAVKKPYRGVLPADSFAIMYGFCGGAAFGLRAGPTSCQYHPSKSCTLVEIPNIKAERITYNRNTDGGFDVCCIH